MLMRRFVSLCSLLIVGLVLVTAAHPQAQERTVSGELIDVACNMKSIKAGGQGTSSANHAECTLLCASKGMPVGIHAADGVYWVVGDFTKSDNKALLAFVNKEVKASGPIAVVDGRKTIDVKRIELAKASGR